MRKPSQILGALAALQVLGGCAAPGTPPARAPEPVAESPAPAPVSAPAPGWTPDAPSAAVPVPSACRAFEAHATGCSSDAPEPELLVQALEVDDPLTRDEGLAKLQACDAFGPGVVLTLRAELAPPECADVIIGKVLPTDVEPDLADVLTALVYGAHLNRLVISAPRLEPPFSKQQFSDFSKTVLEDWVVTQAQAVYEIAKRGSTLRGYARGVVAVEAGIADMRFVSVVRDVPLPEELSQDAELRDAYYAELDMALMPWKARGRDAALVGLKEFAAAGVLADSRVARARAVLSDLYGGRRIDRLDGLILPAPPAVAAGTVERLVAALPTHLVRHVLPNLDANQPRVLALLLRKGLPRAIRADLESRPLSAETSFALAWGLVRFGQTYWSSVDFAAAEAVLRRTSSVPSEPAELLRGVAFVLSAGPRDAVEMMAHGSRPIDDSSVAVLDAIAKSQGPLAAAAAFDAAYILELWPPPGDAAFWQDLARRYAQAEPGLSDANDKARAKELASAARATAKALLPGRP
ncbi:MAG TPA: hypothetical protein VFU02_02500 [Polyangiaceae bacterium]|nr:hypothetical protein [Polyangiaceae bacterium]